MLTIPPFNDTGDVFEQLAEDVLGVEHPGVQRFSSGGKDGAIDLVVTRNGSRHVFECKQIGEDGLPPAQRRWRKVAKNLKTHLASPDGPTTGQAQYGPWYETAAPIRAYTFCVSSRLANLNQQDELRGEIDAFFQELAQRPHLAHLEQLEVSLLTWDDFRRILEERPHLAFRWFRQDAFPRGLTGLDSLSKHSFRAYLTNDKLPFYSRTAHLQKSPSPAGEVVLGEDALLDQLFDDNGPSGTVITGSGGVGKSRLALELGRRTVERGGFAVRAEKLDAERLDAFIETLNPEQRTLLVIDYVETEPHFEELVDVLNQRRDELKLRLRFVATCRTSYYTRLADVDGIRRLDLSPRGADALAWLQSYREATIERVLRDADLPTSREVIDLCADTPALAVFLAYLKEIGSVDLDFNELLAEDDFGSWFRHQVRKSFPRRKVDENVALWMGLMPLPDPLPDGLKDALDGEVFDRLVMDHWVERTEDRREPCWTTIHDVLADKTILSYLDEKKRGTERGFVERWMDVGRQYNVLESAFVALQRLSGAIPMADVLAVLKRQLKLAAPHIERNNFLLTQALKLEPETFREVALGWMKRHPLEVQTHFLLVAWLNAKLPTKDVEQIVRDWATAFNHRRQLSFVLKSWLDAGGGANTVQVDVRRWLDVYGTTDAAPFVLKSWLDAGGGVDAVRDDVRRWLDVHVTTDSAGFVLKSWLDASGGVDAVRDDVRRWLDVYVTTDAAGFVLKSWLDASGGVDTVRDDVRRWLDVHGTTDAAPFVLKSWLDAGGGADAVRNDVRRWLDDHGTTDAVDFVLKSWLDAGGGADAVRDDVRRWLDVHGTTDAADFVLKSWLDAGGDFDVVKDAAIHWLSRHRTSKDAVFVTKFLAKQDDLPVDTVRDVLTWCRTYPDNEDATWRFSQLADHVLRKELLTVVIETAEAILPPVVDRSDTLKSQVVRSTVNALFYAIRAVGFDPSSEKGRANVDALFANWVRRTDSFAQHKHTTFQWMQEPIWALKLADILRQERLDVEKDRPGLEGFLRWLNDWAPHKKAALRPILGYLRRTYPQTDVWDVVELPPLRLMAAKRSDG